MPQTLTELLREIDRARDSLHGYDVTNHYAYLRWPADRRIEFDVGREKARRRLAAAELAYREAIERVAAADPED